MTPESSTGFGWALALTVGLALMFTVIAAVPRARSEAADAQVAVVFAPWLSGGDVFSRVIAAGARPIRLGRVDTIVVVALENENTSAHLWRQGAWLLLDPIVAGDCVGGLPSN